MNQNHLKVLFVAVVIIGLQLLIVTNPLAGQSTDAAVAINSATKAAIRDAVNDIISGTIEGITVRMAGVMAQTSRQPSPADIQAEERAAAQRAYEEAQQRDWVTKIFAIKNGEPSQIARALSLFRANIAVEDTLRTISVRSRKEIMPAIEEAITKLDVAVRKTVDLTVYVLVASNRTDSGKPLPQSLQPVAAELKKVLSYTEFYLADTLVIQGGDGRSMQLTGTVQLPTAAASSDFSFSANVRIDSSDPKVPVLDLRDFQFAVDARVPAPGQNSGDRGVRLSIRTSVEVPAGQQVVVGKASFGDNALILVMNARFSG